jgi:cytolysin (calcineurin-like family phosphatase)
LFLAPAPSGPTAPGYELTPGLGYYKFHTVAKTWDGARRTCDQEGAHLAVINSEAELNVLTDLFSSVPKLRGVAYNQYAYIGFHDRFSEGEYLTVLGTANRLSQLSSISAVTTRKWGRGGAAIGSVVVEVLCYKPEGRGFKTQ